MEYVRIVDVSLCHEYYNGSSCGFNVVPSAETAEIMKREQILCRIYDGKVRLISPAGAVTENMTLFFFISDSSKTDNPVMFDCVEKSTRLSLYISRNEIPILSGAPSRFRLLDSATSKVLMKTLPNASGKTLAKASLDDGTSALVAECFVNP